MTRIAIAGFQHETNSFGTGYAGMAEYEMADSWPPLLSGKAVITGTRGLNLPIAGCVTAAEQAGIELHPILWGSAEPSGPVTDDAFDTISTRILNGIAGGGKIDGLFLDLHGAMITESHHDGEGALLRRIRERFGPDLPIAVSLDMHGNVTQDFVDLADSVSIYRTYPHLDMAETGSRALAQLQRLMNGTRAAKAFRQLPYIIPMHAQYTGSGTMSALYDAVIEASDDRVQAELAVGFPSGDMADCGPSLFVQAPDQTQADAVADALLAKTLDAEGDFDCRLPTAAEAVTHALSMPPGKPITIADVQDNPGGGASSDTTGLMHALVEAGATGAMLGVLHDPKAAATAHDLGIGATFKAALGGRSGVKGDAPYQGQFRIEALSDGQVTYEGEMYGGGIAQMGASALLSVIDPVAEVQIVVSSTRNQCLDRGYFRHIGVTPEDARILVVKSTVHYRADFEPISQAVLSAGAPGSLSCDITAIPYRNLRSNVRLGPKGPVFGTKCP